MTLGSQNPYQVQSPAPQQQYSQQPLAQNPAQQYQYAPQQTQAQMQSPQPQQQPQQGQRSEEQDSEGGAEGGEPDWEVCLDSHELACFFHLEVPGSLASSRRLERQSMQSASASLNSQLHTCTGT